MKEYTITVPPLRDCQEDIMPLAKSFLEISNRELERDIKGFSASARKALLTYPCPGNVRELKQKIQMAVLHAEHNMITEDNLELRTEAQPVPPSLRSKTPNKKGNASAVLWNKQTATGALPRVCWE